ncbi:MAG: adenylate/guanylate cyclase domain-containing protein [Betaproteobacteria bacterium]|nr:adenylate/guanylate cyclase domain-containing protein [Betaproteobacteria bacterium]
MKKHLVRIALGLAIVLVCIGHAAQLYSIGLVAQLDHIIYDTRLRLTMPGRATGQRSAAASIVILDIDEKSLQEVARWPWPRDVMARLMTKLFEQYKVAIVGLDVVFAERDFSSGIKRLDEMAQKELKPVAGFADLYRQIRPQLDNDGLFAGAIKGRPVVLGYYLNSDRDAKRIAAIPAPVLPKGAFGDRKISFTSWVGFGGNLPEFLQNAAASGHINSLPDDDGVVRRVPMIAELDGQYYEALSLAMVRTLLGFPKIEPDYPPERFANKDYSGLEWLKVGPLTIPVDEMVSTLIPYRGERGSFPYISLADVLNDRVPPEQLKGKIAFIGTSAHGLLDLRSTPVDNVYPGVEIHANLVAGILDRTLKQRPPFMLGAEVLLLIIGGAVLALLMPALSPLYACLVGLAGIGLISGLNLVVWSYGDMVLPLAASLLMTLALFTVNMAYGYFVEARSKRQFTDLFGQYVPPELVDEMAKDPEKYSMEPKAAELTILFSDVRGFTGISEALSPEDLKEYINDYLTTMSAIIRRNRGTLDKYIGDAIMAFWGAPVSEAEHARLGVISALEMQSACEEVRQRFRARGWPEFNIGVGLNSGNVRVGDMGSKVRKAYTAMGDPVNLASRLEGRTKTYGAGILVGEATRILVMDVEWKELDLIKVKGKDSAVRVFEPIGIEGQVDTKVLDEIKLWHRVLKSYRSRAWDRAEAGLRDLEQIHPHCKLYALYAGRVSEYRRSPPPVEWAGVTVFDEK